MAGISKHYVLVDDGSQYLNKLAYTRLRYFAERLTSIEQRIMATGIIQEEIGWRKKLLRLFPLVRLSRRMILTEYRNYNKRSKSKFRIMADSTWRLRNPTHSFNMARLQRERAALPPDLETASLLRSVPTRRGAPVPHVPRARPRPIADPIRWDIEGVDATPAPPTAAGNIIFGPRVGYRVTEVQNVPATNDTMRFWENMAIGGNNGTT